MSYYNEKSKVPTIILWVVVALVTVGMIVAIVVGVIRSKQTNDPIDRVPTNETTEPSDTESGVTKPDTPNADIPVITPGTEQGGDETEPPEETTEPGHVSVDILDANKENEKENTPHIVGDVSVLPGVKEEGNETNN